MTLFQTPQSKSGIPLATKRGSLIENDGPSPQRAPEAMREAARMAREGRASVRVRSLSSTYNCVGLALASRRANVSPSLVLWILAEDGYRQLGSDGEHAPGDIVLYFDEPDPIPKHVGIVAKRQRLITPGGRGFGDYGTWVLSQWGHDGEYLHRLRDVPEPYGNHVEYWTDRIDS